VTGQHPRLLDAVTIPIGPQAVQVGGTTYYVPKGVEFAALWRCSVIALCR
jgi:hypothetical protein